MNIKICPSNITNTKRTVPQLEAFSLFAVAVAGKRSEGTARKTNSMLEGKSKPFAYLRKGRVDGILKRHKIGQYDRLGTAIDGLKKLDLKKCSQDDLLKVRGIGPKTANFFLLHSREGYDGAVLDTHILRWVREVHKLPAPKTTPSGNSYKNWEVIAKKCMKKSYPQKSLADADLLIWKKMSGN